MHDENPRMTGRHMHAAANFCTQRLLTLILQCPQEDALQESLCMTEIEVDVVIPPPRLKMGRKLPRRESAILLIATSERRLGDTSIKTGAW